MHLKGISIRSRDFPVTDFYPFDPEVLRKTEDLKFSAPVTFLIGENGCGKSTLACINADRKPLKWEVAEVILKDKKCGAIRRHREQKTALRLS